MKLSLVVVSLLGSLALCRADAVRLKIIGLGGKPVANAKVRIVELKGEMSRRTSLPSHDFTSDANGQIALESNFPLARDVDDLTRAILMARVLAPGFSLSGLRLKANENTLVLTPASPQPLAGVALDADQKPVAGAHLVLATLRLPNDQLISFSDGLELETTSDAQGHWKFEGLPNQGEAVVRVRDARFKREGFPLDLSQAPPPLFLSPGAALKGRVLSPDGQGAPGVRIYGNDFDNQVVTDTNGRFEINGLSDQTQFLQVMFGNQKLPFIASPLLVEGLKPGATRDLGDWKTEQGILLMGRLINSVSKKPVEGATVSVWAGSMDSYAQSDETGAFQARIAQSAQRFSVNATGFADFMAVNVPDPKNGVLDMGTVPLVAGQEIKGVLQDEAGNPVVKALLYATKPNSPRHYAHSDSETGAFSFGVLEAGNYTLHANNLEITSGASFGVEAKPTPSLNVVVKTRAIQAGTSEKQSIQGHVADAEGAPIAGARIVFRLKTKGGSSSQSTALSQNDGTFKAPLLLSNITLSVISVSRPGFVRAMEKIESENDDYRVNLTLQKRGEAVRGRVVDAEGLPVVGAYVAMQNGEDLPVATDENGAFALLDVPLTGAPLFASNGPSLARFTPEKAGEPIEIKLPASVPAEDKALLADKVLANASLSYDWQKEWDVLGPKRIEALLVARRTNKIGVNWLWTQYFQELAQRQPQTLLMREAELRALTPAEIIPDFDRFLMLARAKSTDEAERTKARDWLHNQEQDKRDINAATVTRMLGMAQVGFALDPKYGAMWLDYAAQIANQVGGGSIGNAYEWGLLAASISPDAPQIFSEDWSSTAQMQFLVPAMLKWQLDGNITAATQGWKTLQELAPDAALHPDPKVQADGFVQKPDDLLRTAQSVYARLLAQTDAKAALSLADSLHDHEKPGTLQIIAKAAVEQKQFEVARQALLLLFDTSGGDPQFFAEGALLAEKFDPALAAQLWPRAYAKARPRSRDVIEGGLSSIAAYAGARAKTWPGESRILIEREWTWRLAQSATPHPDYDPTAQIMRTLATAMASLSPSRALEMLEQIPEKDDLRAQARADVAVALLEQP